MSESVETATSTATAAAAANAAKRIKRSERILLDESGVPTKKMELATGFRYVVLHDGNPTGSIEMNPLGEAGKPSTMFACFGGHTKVGNVLNAIVNDDAYDNSDPYPGISEWFAGMNSDDPIWSERKAGVGSRTKFDKDIWATVLASQANATLDEEAYRAKLDDEPSWYAKVRARATLVSAYYEYVGTQVEGDDADLL